MPSRSRAALIVASLALPAFGCWSGTGAPPGRLDPAVAQDPLRVSSLAAGAAHTCALRADGAVLCWGSNEHGQLGRDVAGRIGWEPARARDIDDAVQIAAISGVSCALRRTGGVRCWGSVRKGRRIAAREDVPGIAGAREIAVGHGQVTAALGDGTVVQKSLRDDAPARRVEGLAAVEHVVAGYRHACAVTHDGAVWCWGQNDHGELGDGTTRSSARPVRVGGLGPTPRIAASQRATCAWPSDGSVSCWGNLGAPTPFTEPFKLPMVSGLVGAVGARRKACGWFQSGRVECVTRGKLGPDRAFVPGLGGAIQVVAGHHHFCALERTGKVSCWGSSEGEELGDPRAASASPRRVPGLDDARDLVTASHYACAARASGAVVCWGKLPFEDAEGTAPRAVPKILADRLAGNGSDLCAIDRAGTPRCWGANLAWTGAAWSGGDPLALPALSDARSIALGLDFACALGAGGRVRCTGKNRHGELGDGSTVARREAVAVSGLGGVAEIAQSEGLVCARLEDGHVTCWGITETPDRDAPLFLAPNDDAYSLEISLPNSAAWRDRSVASPAPVTVAGLDRVTRLDRVASDLCAIREGVASCWSRADRLTPKPVAGLRRAVSLSGSRGHRCALLDDERVACWGQNDLGQLGNAGPAVEVPTVVPGSEGSVQVAAGDGFTCARSKSGAVRCWGSNRFGELGDGGSFADRAEPIEVSRAALRTVPR